MLRYFIATNFWLALTILLLVSSTPRYQMVGNASQRHYVAQGYAVFGFGNMSSFFYWTVISLSILAVLICFRAWKKTESISVNSS
ncbi:hypothetical protein [Gimesia sp.]|uniref:hypothetical protein n=1 Tax=Gimesia sp. TaxID=2024833 RepID=UPI003A91A69D